MSELDKQENVEVNIDTLPPEANPLETGKEDFFDQLDRQVMGSALEPSEQSSSPTQVGQTTSHIENSVVSESVDNDYTTLEKRYSDSSREAKRLNTRLTELEPYLPVLDAMKEDPNLVSHVRGYFEGGGSAPKDLKSQLGLNEDFMFDYDEAISDPNSGSAKLFQATVDGVVQRRIGEFAQQQTAKNAKVADEAKFREQYKVNDGEYGELVDFAKGHKLTLEDVYFLKNREGRDQVVADNVRREQVNQMKNARAGTPQSIASVGNESRGEQSLDDQVFDQLLGVGERLNDIGL
jgi:hypothetical protein